MALKRDMLQRQKLCIGCGKPSATQRCSECARRVEEATNRYRGRARIGAPTKTQYDLVDMKHIGEAWSKALTLLMEIERKSPMSPRRLDEARSEPMSQISMINRASAEILVRNGFDVKVVRVDIGAGRKAKKQAPAAQLAFKWKEAA